MPKVHGLNVSPLCDPAIGLIAGICCIKFTPLCSAQRPTDHLRGLIRKRRIIGYVQLFLYFLKKMEFPDPEMDAILN
jgi:hypothetical protein